MLPLHVAAWKVARTRTGYYFYAAGLFAAPGVHSDLDALYDQDHGGYELMNRCKRCNHPLKDPLADYGPVCGKKVAANARLDGNYPVVVRNKKGDITAVIV